MRAAVRTFWPSASGALQALVLPLTLTASLTLTSVWLVKRGAPVEGVVHLPTSQRAARTLPYGALTVVDSSGHGHDGIAMGDTVRGVQGHRGTAFFFADRGSWVEVLPDDELNPHRRDFLVSAFVRLPRPPRGHATFDIVRKGVSFTPGGEFKLEIVRRGEVRCTAKDRAGAEARITSPLGGVADGRWHTVGCARIGTTWTVLVDGAASTSEQPMGGLNNAMPLAIGSKYGEEDVPDGSVDEVALHVGHRLQRGGPPVATTASDEPAGGPGETVEELIERLSAREPVAHWSLDER